MASRSNSSRKAKRTAIPTEDPDDASEEEKFCLEMAAKPGNTHYSHKNPNVHINQPSAPSLTEMMASKMDKSTKYIVFPSFIATAIASALMILLAYFKVMDSLISLIVIIVLTIVTAYIGMYGVYKWGALDEQIEFYKKQNEAYQRNASRLKNNRVNLKQQVKAMQHSVENLDEESVELQRSVEAFNELKEALKEVVGDNEEIMDVIDALNQQYTDMQCMGFERDRAQLLLTYYKLQLGGRQRKAFGRPDYERFLDRLNSTTRNLYVDYGGFDALDIDKNGNVDPDEFMKVTDKVLLRASTTLARIVEENSNSRNHRMQGTRSNLHRIDSKESSTDY